VVVLPNYDPEAGQRVPGLTVFLSIIKPSRDMGVALQAVVEVGDQPWIYNFFFLLSLQFVPEDYQFRRELEVALEFHNVVFMFVRVFRGYSNGQSGVFVVCYS